MDVTLIAYVLTVVAAFSSLTSIPAALLAAPAQHAGALAGGILSWILISWLWVRFEGGELPILALGGAFIILGIHGSMSHDELTRQSKMCLVAEMWGILVVAGFLIWNGPRWI